MKPKEKFISLNDTHTSLRNRFLSCCFQECFGIISIKCPHFCCTTQYQMSILIMWRENLNSRNVSMFFYFGGQFDMFYNTWIKRFFDDQNRLLSAVGWYIVGSFPTCNRKEKEEYKNWDTTKKAKTIILLKLVQLCYYVQESHKFSCAAHKRRSGKAFLFSSLYVCIVKDKIYIFRT